MEFSRPKKKDGTQPPPKRGEIKVGIMRKLVKMIVSAGAKAKRLGKSPTLVGTNPLHQPNYTPPAQILFLFPICRTPSSRNLQRRELRMESARIISNTLFSILTPDSYRGSEGRLTKERGNVIPIFIARFANVHPLVCAFWWPIQAMFWLCSCGGVLSELWCSWR
ncbi:hypothetical protein Droror1_Dr00016344 [Drosera rotundifolia]